MRVIVDTTFIVRFEGWLFLIVLESFDFGPYVVAQLWLKNGEPQVGRRQENEPQQWRPTAFRVRQRSAEVHAQVRPSEKRDPHARLGDAHYRSVHVLRALQ